MESVVATDTTSDGIDPIVSTVRLATTFRSDGFAISLKVIISNGVVGVSSEHISSLVQPRKRAIIKSSKGSCLFIRAKPSNYRFLKSTTFST